MMRVIPEISSVVPQPVPLGNGVLGTAFNIQRIETTVTAFDGETVALGGLITKRDTKAENKIPWLGDLPGVGALFRFRTHSKSKAELLVILTPRIVRSRSDADRVLAEEARKMDWVLGDVYKIHGHHTEHLFGPVKGPHGVPIGVGPHGAAPHGVAPHGVDGHLPPAGVPVGPLVPGVPYEIGPLPRALPKESALPKRPTEIKTASGETMTVIPARPTMAPGTATAPLPTTIAPPVAAPILPAAHTLVPTPVRVAPEPLPPAKRFTPSAPPPLPLPPGITGPALAPPPLPIVDIPPTSKAPAGTVPGASSEDLAKTLSRVESWSTRIPLPGQDLPMETNRVFTSRYPVALPTSSSVSRTVIGR
jgi:hypothetical protein